MAALLVLTVIACSAQADAPPPVESAMAIGTAEAGALLKIVRSRVGSGNEMPLPEPVPAIIEKALDLPLIVALYQDGLSRFHHVSTQPTLRESAEEAGDELKRFLARPSVSAKLFDEGRITLDIVTGGKRVDTPDRAMLSQQLIPGVEGLQCVGEQRTDYFTPLTVLKHGRDLDIVEKMYISQASMLPPKRFRAIAFQTRSFVEDRPGGTPLRLYRGNTSITSSRAYTMVEAMSRAGMWLLRTQRENGSFPAPYYPADEVTAESPQDMGDHARTARGLQSLYTLVGEKSLLEASNRAIDFAVAALQEKRTQRMAFLPDKRDPISASALLLNALCRKAVSEPNPTVTGPMRYLAEFLCVMVDEEGRLYASVSKALEGSPPYVVKGEPYAETLIALTLYQHVLAQSETPGGRAAIASRSLAACLSALPAALPNTLTDTHAWPRTIEALAQYSELSGDRKSAEAALKLASRLAKRQITPGKGRHPDYEGGFTEHNLPPSTAFTSAALCAMVDVYGIERRMDRPADKTAASIRRAAEFLMNMQYREENTFFLRFPSLSLGAFRRMPEDLSIYPADVALATRALMLAASVTAETEALEAQP